MSIPLIAALVLLVIGAIPLFMRSTRNPKPAQQQHKQSSNDERTRTRNIQRFGRDSSRDVLRRRVLGQKMAAGKYPVVTIPEKLYRHDGRHRKTRVVEIDDESVRLTSNGVQTFTRPLFHIRDVEL